MQTSPCKDPLFARQGARSLPGVALHPRSALILIPHPEDARTDPTSARFDQPRIEAKAAAFGYQARQAQPPALYPETRIELTLKLYMNQIHS
jgi:hypothetical protein